MRATPAALAIRPGQREGVAFFSIAALLAILILWRVGQWYARNRTLRASHHGHLHLTKALTPRRVKATLAILVTLIFSKFVYMASIGSYFTFYLIHKFGVTVPTAQLYLFIFQAAVAVGTITGGPLGDRFGRKYLIWFSILGTLPFALAMPYANLFWTGVLGAGAGLVLSSAFPAIVVYGQELLPGRVGLGQAGLGARDDQRQRQRVFRLETVVLGAEGRVLQPLVFQFLERDRHCSNSFARLSARRMACGGVFCVFFTKARRITTRRPRTVI